MTGRSARFALLFPVALCAQEAYFNRSTLVPFGGVDLSAPAIVVSADFNQDGKPDLASGGGGVTILLGDGRGGFASPGSIQVQGVVTALAALDFNQDGRADLVAISSSGAIVALPGKGDGTFLNPVTTPLPMLTPPASGLAAADFNGDGRPDLAITSGAGAVSVYLNEGSSRFRTGATLSSGQGNSMIARVAAADFDGDGRADVVAGRMGASAITFFRGRGDGSFETEQSIEVCRDSAFVLAADFNRDGASDLLVGSSGGDGIWLLTGSASGFSSTAALATRMGAAGLAAADFNGDGLLDVAVALSTPDVQVAFGLPEGGFSAFRSISNAAAVWLAAADFNADGAADMAVADVYSQSVEVFLGSASGAFTPSAILGRVQASDIRTGTSIPGPRNGLALISQTAGAVLVTTLDPQGRPGAISRYPTGRQPYRMLSSDFNGDGIPDLAVGNQYFGDISILPGSPEGGFLPERRIDFGNRFTTLLATADVDGDGIPDLVVSYSGVSAGFLKGNGDGSFQAVKTLIAGTGVGDLVAADFTFDAAVDFVYSDPLRGVVLARGRGDGTFEPPVTIEPRAGVVRLAVADLDRDGRPDLLVIDPSSVTISVLMNRDGRLVAASSARAIDAVTGIAVADLNDDAYPDIALASFVARAAVLLGNGDGTFQPARSFPMERGATGLALHDVNGDGRLELVVSNARGAAILWNDASTPPPPTPSTPVPLSPNASAPVAQNNPGSGCKPDPLRGSGFVVRFEWTPSQPAEAVTGYELFIAAKGASEPLANLLLPPVGFYELRQCGYVTDAMLEGWEWRVRAVGAGSIRSEWSAATAFRFLPCRLSTGGACGEIPPGGAFAATASMSVARARHTATLLANGSVLIAGGDDYGGQVHELTSAELYDPKKGSFSQTGSMRTGRASHTATLLTDGRVLIAGGVFYPAPPAQPVGLASAEIYDPATGRFTAAGNMSVARFAHIAVRLPDGRVLIAGGATGYPLSTGLPTAELFNPATGTFSPTGAMTAARYWHTATLLQQGWVLIAGGAGLTATPNEIYDPQRGAFGTTSPPLFPQFSHTATLTGTQVLLAGGFSLSGPTAAAQVWETDMGRFSPAASMPAARQLHGAALLADNSVLITGGAGFGGNSRMPVAERYIPASRQFVPVPAMMTPRADHTATTLQDGRVLIVGGTAGNDAGIWWLNSAELFVLPAPAGGR